MDVCAKNCCDVAAAVEPDWSYVCGVGLRTQADVVVRPLIIGKAVELCHGWVVVFDYVAFLCRKVVR